jgi:transposase
MLTGEEVMEIRVLHRQGMSIRGIARTTGISCNVVRRYLRSPGAPRYKRRAPRQSKLDPFKSYAAERLRAAAPSRASRQRPSGSGSIARISKTTRSRDAVVSRRRGRRAARQPVLMVWEDASKPRSSASSTDVLL